jgi:preprotein translocase subunit SecA
MSDLVYRTPENKFKAVIDDIVEANQRKQPVLVGTVAIETSELVSQLLKRRGVDHEVLNAKNHEREATIIAQAGRPGAVTIATNMAGRGVDILLGGNFEGLAREQLRREEIELSEIPQAAWNHAMDMAKHGQDVLAAYPGRWAEVLLQKYKETERDKELVRSLGGLYVIGTERHEARRIDNQLRGRSGRLGDPGQSRFYLSLGDDLMRRFGGERISGIMARLGVEDDMPIEAGVVSKAIENAQTKVEGHNFDMRKHVLQYDEVVNEQRNRIYDQRRRILNEPSMKVSIETMIDEEISSLAATFTSGEEQEWELDSLVQALGGLFHLPADFAVEKTWNHLTREEIEDSAVEMALASYEAKEAMFGAETMRRFEKQILLWAVDNRWIRHLTDLDRLREGIGLQAFAQVDPLVAYKREAFNMYSELMNDIRGDVVKAVLTLQLQPKVVQGQQGHGQTQAQATGQSQAQAAGQTQGQNNGGAAGELLSTTPIARNIRTNRDAPAAQTVRKSGPDVGRNDPCWCGSGKKYKNCHMNSDRAKADGKPVAAGR